MHAPLASTGSEPCIRDGRIDTVSSSRGFWLSSRGGTERRSSAGLGCASCVSFAPGAAAPADRPVQSSNAALGLRPEMKLRATREAMLVGHVALLEGVLRTPGLMATTEKSPTRWANFRESYMGELFTPSKV